MDDNGEMIHEVNQITNMTLAFYKDLLGTFCTIKEIPNSVFSTWDNTIC